MKLRLVLALYAVLVLGAISSPIQAARTTQGPYSSATCTVAGGSPQGISYDVPTWRFYETTQLATALSQQGGSCQITFDNRKSFVLNNEWGTITLDGVGVTPGRGLHLTGTVLTIGYQANQANGFDLTIDTTRNRLPWILRDPKPTPVPTATPIPTTAFNVKYAQCNIWKSTGASPFFTESLEWDGSAVWMTQLEGQLVKENAATCYIEFTSYTLFYFDTVAGTVTIDDRPSPNGNHVEGAGVVFKVDYPAPSAANGLAIYKH